MLLRYYHTLRHLKLQQIGYQIYYRLKRRWSHSQALGKEKPDAVLSPSPNLSFPAHPYQVLQVKQQEGKAVYQFNFLNISQQFEDKIDWNFSDHGKLWTYNLNYFDFLLQEDISAELGHDLIEKYYRASNQIKDGFEPYPISLRLINWFKFFSRHGQPRQEILEFSFRQLKLLSRWPEYHLMGNHLLENGFALVIGGYWFKNKEVYQLGAKILKTQLAEQLLADGGHFERSPMYHAILLDRLLDVYQIVSAHQDVFVDDLEKKLKRSVAWMLGWLTQFCWSDGSWAHLNDSTNKIAKPFTQLLAYANQLEILSFDVAFRESGYRYRKNQYYHAILDVGPIGPDYIPGHAHSDSLQLVLQSQGKDFIVDPGISTYENNPTRQWERSTQAHNTVQLSEYQQSEVWAAFRVARRAKTQILSEAKDEIIAQHDGYKPHGIIHQRSFVFAEQSLRIVDELKGKSNLMACAHFHFWPGLDVQLEGQQLVSDLGSISWEGAEQVLLEDYEYATGFNQRQRAKKLLLYFCGSLATKIQF